MTSPARALLAAVAAAAALLSAPARAAYSEAAALRYVKWVGASYCPFASLQAWSCAPCDAAARVANLTAIHNATTNVTGYVGLAAATNEVVVAFHGSEGVENWLENFDVEFVPANLSVAAPCPGCLISRGFSLDTYATVRVALLAAVRATLALAGPGALLVVSGHSLGAAIAEVATLDLLGSDLPPHAGLAHYSFGTPRVGNAAWASTLHAAASASRPDSYFRIVHALDPVPRLPPAVLLGYAHPPREVWYSENSSSFVVCSADSGEDPACSDSDAPFGTRDHVSARRRKRSRLHSALARSHDSLTAARPVRPYHRKDALP